MNSDNLQDIHIDENLYSRPLYVLGHEALKKMANSNIFISGLGGLGVEIAKNVILSGVKSVTIHDTKQAEWNDLSSQFYLDSSNLGQNRAVASLHKLSQLNPYVSVQAITEVITSSLLSNFNVAVFTDYTLPELISLNEMCRKLNVKFIAVESRGLFGMVFCDFGTQFEVVDSDGEQPVVNLVTHISNEQEAVVTVHDEKLSHGLYDGDLVSFEDVEGMDEINGKIYPIKSTGKHSFTIGDTTDFGKYIRGGFVKQIKKKCYMDFLSLKESLEHPKCLDFDFSKVERSLLLHSYWRALGEFHHRFDRLPNTYNEVDALQMIEFTKVFFKGKESILSDHTIKLLSFTARGNLSPMAAFLGGMAAQEVQKAVSGKFSPLNQFLFIDFLECLPDPLPNDVESLQSRYDGQIVVFGKVFQEKLLQSNVFLVGSGALGCEYLKSYALMGVACGERGKLVVTDMDSIEVSNLSRQFLFRKEHIGKSKSIVAAETVKGMNPDLKILALCDKVGLDTEDTFNSDFWLSIDWVTNALDNLQARLYIDAKCVRYNKPLLEAGTLGSKGNVQVVIPHLTESYGSSADPPETEFAICTVKLFPNMIEHCIQWGREIFEGLFKKEPEEINSYLTRPNFINELESQIKDVTIEHLLDGLVTSKPISFEDCVVWARLKFEELFSSNIKKLVQSFPIDAITSSGASFWGGPKRPPSPLVFDVHEETHLNFVIAAANLRAQVYGLRGNGSNFDYVNFFSKLGNMSSSSNLMEDEEVQSLQKLPSPSSLIGYQVNPVEFEKDDDSNFHLDFIAAASNLRARNYRIKEETKHNIKGIAGKIVPAMVTTTALITGLALLECYKLGKQNIHDYRNSFVNIALPFITLSEPIAPKTFSMFEKQFTLWDKIIVNLGKDISLQQFLEYFENEYQIKISMISCGKATIYPCFAKDAKKKLQERLQMPLSQVVKEITKQPVKSVLELEITSLEMKNEDSIPLVLYFTTQ